MGWASGFRAGSELAKSYQEGQQRRAYEGIQSQKAESSQGYTAEDGAKLEELAKSGLYDIVPQYGAPTDQTRANGSTVGEFTGYSAVPKSGGGIPGQDAMGLSSSPQQFNPGQVTDFLGKRYAGSLDEGRETGLRSRAMAEATTDPRERQLLMSAAIKADRDAVLAGREDELYPLQMQAAQQGVNRGRLELGKLERAEKDAQALATFSEWSAANPDASMEAMMAEAKRSGMSTPAIFAEAEARTGIGAKVFENNANVLKELVQGKNLGQLLKLHQSNDKLDPGSHFVKITGSGGKVSLQRVNSETLQPMGGSVFTGTEDQALTYLNKAATDPSTIAAYTLELENAARGVRTDEANIGRINAQTNLYNNQALVAGIRKPASNADINAYTKMLMTPDPQGRPQINPETLAPYTLPEARAEALRQHNLDPAGVSGPPAVDYAAVVAAKEKEKGDTKTGVVSAGNIATQVGDRQAAKAEETRLQGLSAQAAQEGRAFADAASLEGIDQLTPAVIAETSRSQVAQIYNSPMFKAMSRDQKVAVMRRMQNMPPVASGGLR